MEEKPSAAWYLAPIFLGVIGSAIMWYVLKDEGHTDSPKMVRKGWVIGIALTIIPLLIWIPMMTIMQNQWFMPGMMNNQQFQNQWWGPMMGHNMMGHNMMGPAITPGGGAMSPQNLATMESIKTSTEPQTRTFDIILDEVEFFAQAENEQGEEETVLVELHQWNPNLIVVNKGDTVVLNISNPRKHTHTFSIPEFGISTKILEPRTGSETIQFVADKSGVFTFACGLPYNPGKGQCDPDHSTMSGTLIVLG